MATSDSPAAVGPVPTVRRSSVRLHGQHIAYVDAGEGPALLLLHGLAEASWIWESVIPLLALHHRVIAPDLLGHGDSTKPRGDYSIGAQATLMRDLLVALDVERATLVGHSLGGGISMQFAYQYPERCERLVLIASGGLGLEVNLVLRSTALPGASIVAPLIFSKRVTGWLSRSGPWLRRNGISPRPAQASAWRVINGLTDPAAHRAFTATVAGVVDRQGQRISALDRVYLTSAVPTLILWGARDRIIPVSHAHAAHRAMPGSRLGIVEGAGHFLPLECPRAVSSAISTFVAATEPANVTPQQLRDAILADDA